MNDLNARLLTAHQNNDAALLANLYTQAADRAKDPDAAGFYLTHAYVFALESGSETAQSLRTRLIGMGRETPL